MLTNIGIITITINIKLYMIQMLSFSFPNITKKTTILLLFHVVQMFRCEVNWATLSSIHVVCFFIQIVFCFVSTVFGDFLKYRLAISGTLVLLTLVSLFVFDLQSFAIETHSASVHIFSFQKTKSHSQNVSSKWTEALMEFTSESSNTNILYQSDETT